MRMLQHARRDLDLAAELAAERPFRVLAVAKDATEHLRARCDACDLLDLDLAVDREQADALLVGLLDVALLLDRVSIGNAIGGRAPAASTISISPIEAQSKQEPSWVRSSRICASGLAFTA